MKLRTFVRSAMLALPLTAACGEVRAFEAAFRGSYVCERMASTRDILRVPLELTVHGDRAEFRRPLLDLEGNRRGRVELARGSSTRAGKRICNRNGASSATPRMADIVARSRHRAAP